MRFRTRAFFLCFIPFALLFAASFWMAQRLVQSTVRSGLLASLTTSQLALARAQAEADLQSSRFLTIEGQNPELQSGMQSLLSDTATGDATAAGDAHKAMEDQLRALGDQMGFDLLFVSAPDGAPLVGLVRPPASRPGQKSQLVPLENMLVTQPGSGLLVLGDRIFQFDSAPIGGEAGNLGTLSVGQIFELPQPGKPAVLVRAGDVIDYSLTNVGDSQIRAVMKGCVGRRECDFRLGGANWIAIPMQQIGDGYILWSVENVDAAAGPVRTRLRSFFLFLELGSLLIALLSSIVSSRSIEKPIAQVISQLRKAEQTGELPVAPPALSSTTEIRELTESYTRAAISARNARQKLESAYVEFIGSLANALDARDRYTAGHSGRVSQYSSATAAAMGLDKDSVEQIRIGALLHDIGKIGIPDSLLQKPGRLTAEEFVKVQEHLVIGRRILEGVEGFAAYLDAVELHHENWDGSGYPGRQSGEETPIEVRIIHVSDAYDAMTSDRSYRPSMTHEQAIDELIRYAGTQFDARIVEAFVNLPSEMFAALTVVSDPDPSEHELEAAEAD